MIELDTTKCLLQEINMAFLGGASSLTVKKVLDNTDEYTPIRIVSISSGEERFIGPAKEVPDSFFNEKIKKINTSVREGYWGTKWKVLAYLNLRI